MQLHCGAASPGLQGSDASLLSAVHASLATELHRLEEDNALLRERCARYEGDIGTLVDASSLGHSNPKQKLQYHLRYTQFPCCCLHAMS